MKIAGFQLGKKHFIILGIIIVLIFIFVKVSEKSEEEAHQKQLEASNNSSGTDSYGDDMGSSFDDEDDNSDVTLDPDKLALYDKEQQALIKVFGFPPEGYVWDEDRNLVAISYDEMTVEDVVYGFLRNISMLDFSTACRYASNSVTIDSYKNYYEDNIGDVSTTTAFLRKLYKLTLTNIEILEISDTAIFKDGTEFVTVRIRGLDLTSKDFWVDDRDEIFSTLYRYTSGEKDTDKMLNYLYDYIYNKYKSDEAPKKEYEIELVLTKGLNKGWLIFDDTALYNVVSNVEGNNLYQYILDDFEDFSSKMEQSEGGY